MTYRYTNIILVFSLIGVGGIFLLFVDPVIAIQSGVGTDYLAFAGGGTGLTSGDPRVFVASMIQAILGVTGTILAVLFVLSGYWFLIAHGRSEYVEKAKKTMVRAVLGLIIVLSAYSLTTFVKNSLTTFQSDGPAGPPGGQTIQRCCAVCYRTDGRDVCNADTFKMGVTNSVFQLGTYTIPAQGCSELTASILDPLSDRNGGRWVVKVMTDRGDNRFCSTAIPHPPIP